MAERSHAVVHTEGDEGDVLFQLPPLFREMREGDEFVFTDSSGSIRYKIETVLPYIELVAGGAPSNPDNLWKPPVVYYGVSVVP